MVKQTAENSLTDHRHLLKIAFLSVIDSCRSDPEKFNILYHNLPLITKNRDEYYHLVIAINMIMNYLWMKSRPTNMYNNDYVYEKYLLYEAERFF